MAFKHVCRSCLFAMRQQRLRVPSTPGFKRLFATQTSTPALETSPKVNGDRPITLPADDSVSTTVADKKTPQASKSKPEATNYSKQIASSMQKLARESTETYVAYGATTRLFQECARQADYKIKRDDKGKIVGEVQKAEGGEDLGTPLGEALWYKKFNLPCTFNNWAQITFLHMWLLTARLRLFPSGYASTWHQHLLDHFSSDAERRMIEYHALSSNMIRQRFLKDLFIQWRGCLAAYDEGLVKGDAVLAAAIWRNVFGGRDLLDGDVDHVAAVVEYVRYWARALDQRDNEDIAVRKVEFDLAKLTNQPPEVGENKVELVESS